MSTPFTWRNQSTEPGEEVLRGRVAFWLPFAAAALILSSQLLVPPITGVPDNGDYFNVQSSLKLEPAQQYEKTRFFYYLVPLWRFAPAENGDFRLLTSDLL